MSTNDVEAHLEKIESPNDDDVQDALNYLYNNIEMAEGLAFDNTLSWNPSYPISTTILKPFTTSLIGLLRHDNEEFRMGAAEFLRWSDELTPALAESLVLALHDPLCDVRDAALMALVELRAVSTCDSIYRTALLIHEEEGGDWGIIDCCMDYIIALGKFGDEMAYQILQGELDAQVSVDYVCDVLALIDTPRSREFIEKLSN